MKHTDAVRRIPVQSVPRCAWEFLEELIGEGPAFEFFTRYYAPEVPEGSWGWRP